MTICIDVQSVISNPKGVGRYTLELVKALSDVSKDADITLSYFNFLGRYSGLPYFPNRPIRVIPGRVYNKLWKKCHFPPFDWLAGRYDVYHFPNFCLPPMTRALDNKFIITVHDLCFMRLPEYIEPKNLEFLKAELPRSLERVHKIIAVSNFTKGEIINIFGIREEKITVIYEGVNSMFRKTSEKKMILPDNYILFVGTIEPRKNIEGLIQAFSICRLKDYKLVIAGEKGWFYKGAFEIVAKLGLEKDVIFPGYIKQEDLPELYSRARAFVFPSFYEGFGLPLLEAMACGVPVVSTKFEVSGNAARFINPKEPEDIAKGIREVVNNPGPYISKGLEQAGKFTWRKGAEETLELYNKI